MEKKSIKMQDEIYFSLKELGFYSHRIFCFIFSITIFTFSHCDIETTNGEVSGRIFRLLLP